MIEQKVWNLLWAKSNPKKSLKAHMIETGLCAMEYLKAPSSISILNFLQKMWSCSKQKAIGRAAYLCSVHDIGKAYPLFQKKNEEYLEAWKQAGYEKLFPKTKNLKFRHEYYSAFIMKRIWTEDKEHSMDKILADYYSQILALHHQKKERSRKYKADSIEWREIQKELEFQMRQFFIPNDYLEYPKHIDAICLCLTGLMILCDWIASSEPFDQLEEHETYMEICRRTVKETLILYGLISDNLFPTIYNFKSMWSEMKVPRPLQSVCEELDANNALLTIIEAPMGEGKTEAALYLAGKLCNIKNKRGIYMALPTQATSNQMVVRVKKMLNCFGIEYVRLLHGSAFIQEKDEIIQNQMSEQASEWLKPMRRAMLGENAVGTIDQAMAAVLNIKFSVLRLLGLQNKVLVIDEIHASDMYMSEIIAMLLRWCRVLEIPVIMLSATLQNAQKKKYLSCYNIDFSEKEKLPYPLLTQVDENGKVIYRAPRESISTAYRFKPIRQMGNIQVIAELAVEKVKNGGCLCVLVNTVKLAQNVYKEICTKNLKDIEVLLFHARFTNDRRSEIEKICLMKFGKQRNQRPKKAILVATQVIEQSLDIDFDGMLTELAPIDLLLQRAGRIHRHRENQRPFGFEEPVIEVLLPVQEEDRKPEEFRYGVNGCIYDPFLLYNTEQMLKKEYKIHVPSDMRTVIEAVYNNLTEENIASFLKRQIEQDYKRNEALSNIFNEPDKDTFFFMEADSSFDFSISDIDDGMETKKGASTRMGEESIRLSFCGKELFQKAKEEKISSDDLQAIFKQSALLRLPNYNIDYGIEDNEKIFKIKHGMLKGCLVCNETKECNLGVYHIFNDIELGIYWEE